MENKEIKVKYLENIESDKKSHYWYGGDIVEIDYNDNIKILISANGDVIGHIFNKDGEEVERFKDKRNGAVFYEIGSKYFSNDKELTRATFYHEPTKEELEDLELNYYVYFDNNNWWEVFPVVNGELEDIMMCLDSSNIDDAIEEVISNIDSIIDFIKS